MNPVRPDLAPLVGTERVACGLRLAVGVLLLAMTLQFEPAVSWLAVTAIVLAVGWSVLMFIALRSDLSAAHVTRLAGWSYWFDIGLALAVYLLFLGDPVATPVAGLPLLAYRVALRHGTAGVVGAAVAFVGLVGARVGYTRFTVGEVMVRPPMLLAWALVAVVVLMLAWEARARAALAATAREERAREAAPGREPAVGAAAAPAESGTPTAAAAPGAPEDPEPKVVPRAPDQAAAPAPVAASPVTGDERLDSLAACLALKLEEPAPPPLSQREIEVLVLLGQGLGYNAIASRLFISQSTVRNHVHNIRGKLDVADRDELMTLARAVAGRTAEPGVASG